jgi:membrane fusion protein, multidrug efflux system
MTVRSQSDSAVATAKAAEADFNKQTGDLARNRDLAAKGVISKQDFEHSQSDTQSSRANFESRQKQIDAALANLKEAEKSAQASHAQVNAAKADVKQVEAAEHAAELQLSYTTISAPDDGRVTNKAVESGDYVQVGQNVFALVAPERWVTANFKETQLRKMRAAQPAQVSIDAYPDHRLRGHVDSIQAGSGARFSLLPPENATGNYVKVVQRVPVKIVLDEQPEVQRVLGPGMSVVPDVALSGGAGVAFTITSIAILLTGSVIAGAALSIARLREGQT